MLIILVFYPDLMYLCKTYFSFKYGTYSTKELVSGGMEAGATTLALTNINSTCDAWDFVQYCQEAGIRPIVGVEIRNGNKLLYILLAANNAGFRRISAFLSEHLLEKKDFPDAPVGLYQRPQDGFTVYPFGSRLPEDLRDNERIGILPHEVNRLLRTTIHQTRRKMDHPPAGYLPKQDLLQPPPASSAPLTRIPCYPN
jgi:error-prone DNA polymerase